MQHNMHEIGKAAEHLVCAELILAGHRAFLADAGCPYDVLLDADGHLFRMQVRATQKPVNTRSQARAPNSAYSFSARRRGRFGRERMTKIDCDIVALVALDIRIIAYFPIAICTSSMALVPPGMHLTGTGKKSWQRGIDCFPLEAAIINDPEFYDQVRRSR